MHILTIMTITAMIRVLFSDSDLNVFQYIQISESVGAYVILFLIFLDVYGLFL